MDAILDALVGVAPAILYLFLGAGAALENVVPPVPADTFVLFGGFLAAAERVDAVTVFWVTWGGNVASALAVYAAGYRYGRSFFETGLGRHVLQERQLRRLDGFYARWGFPAIFLTRFLPGLRAVVPAFAGVSHQPVWVVAVPVTVASAIWYGALVWLGRTAGSNWREILGWLGHLNRGLLVVSLLLVAAVGIWWYRSRRRPHARGDDGDPPEEA